VSPAAQAARVPARVLLGIGRRRGSGGDALDDGAWERMAEVMASVACTNACRSDDGKRLETVRRWCASVMHLRVESLRDEERRDVKVVRQREGRRVRPVRGCGVPALSRNRGFATVGLADSGE
jgi:hypothetical protein